MTSIQLKKYFCRAQAAPAEAMDKYTTWQTARDSYLSLAGERDNWTFQHKQLDRAFFPNRAGAICSKFLGKAYASRMRSTKTKWWHRILVQVSSSVKKSMVAALVQSDMSLICNKLSTFAGTTAQFQSLPRSGWRAEVNNDCKIHALFIFIQKLWKGQNKASVFYSLQSSLPQYNSGRI